MAFFDKIGLDKLGARVGGFLDEVLLPEGVAQSLAEAGRLMEREEFDAALRILYRVHAEQPSFSRVHHLIGLCLFHKGDFGQAYKSFERAVQAREEAVSHLYAGLSAERLAAERGESGRLHPAQVHFRRGLQAAGSDELEFELHFGLGRVYLAQGRADKAVRELKKAMKRRPGQQAALLMLGRALIARGKLEEARELLDGAPEGVSPVQMAVVRGALGAAKGDHAGALAAYEQALEAMLTEGDEVEGSEVEGSEVEEALLGAARAALDLGDGPRANQWLLRALGSAQAQRHGEIQALLGRANEAIHNDARALECYRAALGAPQSPGTTQGAARLGLGRILLAHPQFAQPGESARAHFQAVLEQNGLDPALTREAQVGLARACLAQEDFSGARRLVDEVLRADRSPSADILALWGQVALGSGDAAEAALAFEEALGALDTGGPDTGCPDTMPGTVRGQRAGVEAALGEALEAMRFPWNLPGSATDSLALREILRQTLDFVASDVRATHFAPHVQQLVAEFDAPLSVAVVGEFNAGKSTILNALVGEEIVPMGVLPTTAHTCFIRFGVRKAARIVARDGRVLEVDLAEAKQQMKTNAAGIDHLEFLYPHPDLRSVEYWDTPGFNALDEAHEETAQRALQNAEAILWVLDANQALTQTEFAQIEQVSAGAERLLVLLNKIDRLGEAGAREAQVRELVDYIEENTRGRIAGCFAISGREALARRVGAGAAALAQADTTPGTVQSDASGMDASGFREFQQFLDARIIQRSGRIKILEITRKLRGLIGDFDAFRGELVGRYARLSAAGDEIDSWLQGLHQAHPAARALAQARALEDHFDFMLNALTREIEEALASHDTLLGRTALGRGVWAEEDRRFILELLQERIADILERANQQVMSDVEALESQLAQRVGGIIAQLPLADARAMSRRMAGFFDETRVLKMLFGERIFGRLQAHATGQIAAAGENVLNTIRPGAETAAGARKALRQLLPQGRAQLNQELAQWYEEFFFAARRFLNRVQRDLHLLKLEAEYRFDVSALRDLIYPESDLP